MQLGEWLEMWYNLYVTESDLAPSTKAMYRRAIKAVPSTLALIDLTNLTGLQVHTWLVKVHKRTPRAAQLDRVMLHRALKVAAKNKLCASDIIDPDTVPKPRHSPSEAVVLSYEQLMVYLREAAKTDVAPLLMLGACGLRRGEMLSARWEDIDLQAGTIHVHRQRMRIEGKYTLRPLKSRTSERTLYLPDMLATLLSTWPRNYRGWIVDTTPEHLHRVHNRIISQLSLPRCTLHGLRHTFATLAADRAPITQIQHALGHSKIDLTASLYCAHILTPIDTAKALYICG